MIHATTYDEHPVPMCRVSGARIEHANRAMAEFLGLAAVAAMRSTEIHTLVASPATLEELFEEARSTGSSSRRQLTWHSNLGEHRRALTWVTTDSGSDPLGFDVVLQPAMRSEVADAPPRPAGVPDWRLLERTADWMWALDTEGRFTYVSPRVREILGYEPEELIGRVAYDFMERHESGRVRAIVEHRLAGDEGLDGFENVHLAKDGSPVVLQSWAVPIYDDNGEVAGYWGIDHDVTSERRAYEALRERERRLHLIHAASSVGTWEWRPSTGTVIWDEHACRLLGYEPGALPRDEETAIEHFVHPDDRDRTRQFHPQFAAGVEIAYRKRMRAADGSWRWCEFRGQQVGEEPSEGPKRVMGVIVDVHDHVVQDETLRAAYEERDRLLHEIGENLEVAVWLGTATRFLYVNPAFERFYGRQVLRSPKHGWDFLHAIHPEDQDEVGRRYRACIERTEPFVGEYRVRTPAGDVRWIRDQNWPVDAYQDGERLWVAIAQDVTAQKESHDALEEANRVKSEFLAAVSHDLRTPLNAIMGFTDLLADTELDARQQDYLLRCRQGSDKLLQLIDLLLEIARIEAGRVELHTGVFDPRALLRRQCVLVEPTAQSKGITMEAHVDEAVPARFEGDETRVGQILGNLLDNAVKFTDEGHVAITLDWPHDGWLRYTVEDTGPGIPSEARERIFEAFTRGASADLHHQGSGLGLKIVLELVRMMGGTIDVGESARGGACFSVLLPLPKVQSEDATPVPDDDEQVNPGRETGARRVLVAEDDRSNALVLRSLLERQGCEVEVVGDGEQAYEAALAGTYGLVLMDEQMPGWSGEQAAIAIREAEAREGRAPVPIVAVSAHALSEVEDRLRAAGCDDYVTKPVTAERVRDVIARHAR